MEIHVKKFVTFIPSLFHVFIYDFIIYTYLIRGSIFIDLAQLNAPNN